MTDVDKETKQKIISEYMSKLGKKAGEVNKKKGSAYFKKIRSYGLTKKKKEAQSQD